jgi:hypothetical protein
LRGEENPASGVVLSHMDPLARRNRSRLQHNGARAGVGPPTPVVAELKERIAKTIKLIKPRDIDRREDIEMTLPSWATRDFTDQSLLLNIALPDFYLHCGTAFDLSRHCSVELGTPILWGRRYRFRRGSTAS